MSGPRPIRVLIVDDSALVRRMITQALSRDPAIEVVGGAADPYEARDLIRQLHPHVLTLDLEMPRMDGMTFLRILMQHHPLPVIVMSSLTQAGSGFALDALEAGAVEVLAKPNGPNSVGTLALQLAEKVKIAANSKLRRGQVLAPLPKAAHSFHPRQVILLGASTGGTEALKEVLAPLPAQMPGICVVQHLPAHFSAAFAHRLNSLCQLEVRLARTGDLVMPGVVLIAPGDFHMVLSTQDGHYRVRLTQAPPVWHQRPSVDVLFQSAASEVGSHGVAGILTGMGADGAAGLLELRKAGATTFTQDEESCVVYGMPKVAQECGAAQQQFALGAIPSFLVETCQRRRGSDNLCPSK